jgi:hypothetical protein
MEFSKTLTVLLPLALKYQDHSALSIAGDNFISYCAGASVGVVDRINLSWWEVMSAMAIGKNDTVKLRHHTVSFYEDIDPHRAESLLLLWTSILRDLIKEEIEEEVNHVHRSQKMKDQTAFNYNRSTAVEILEKNADNATEEIKKITNNLKYPSSLGLGTSEETQRIALQKVKEQLKNSKSKVF